MSETNTTVEAQAEAPTKTQEIIGVIDMSGSMGRVAADVRGGYNQYLNDLQADTTHFTNITTCCFDTVREMLDVSTPITEAKRLNDQNYRPRGSTALNDSLAYTIADFEKRFEQAGQPVPEDVIVVIFTDGEENASREYDKEAIKSLITEKTEAGWTFVYLGANHDAWAAAQSYGISAQNSMNYAQGETDKTMAYLTSSTMSFRGGTRSKAAFLSDAGETAEESFEKVKDALKTFKDN